MAELCSGILSAVHAGSVLSLGMLLIVGFLLGELFELIKLPAITGYIVAGLVLGSSLLDFINCEMGHRLGLAWYVRSHPARTQTNDLFTHIVKIVLFNVCINELVGPVISQFGIRHGAESEQD